MKSCHLPRTSGVRPDDGAGLPPHAASPRRGPRNSTGGEPELPAWCHCVKSCQVFATGKSSRTSCCQRYQYSEPAGSRRHLHQLVAVAAGVDGVVALLHRRPEGVLALGHGRSTTCSRSLLTICARAHCEMSPVSKSPRKSTLAEAVAGTRPASRPPARKKIDREEFASDALRSFNPADSDRNGAPSRGAATAFPSEFSGLADTGCGRERHSVDCSPLSALRPGKCLPGVPAVSRDLAMGGALLPGRRFSAGRPERPVTWFGAAPGGRTDERWTSRSPRAQLDLRQAAAGRGS